MCPQAELFDRIFRAPEELLAILAPHGWEQSPLLRLVHPTAQQRRDESRALRRCLTALCGKEPERPAPDDYEFVDDAPLIDPHREVVELLGRVIWDVFSNNHTVVDDHGNDCNLGSFRGTAGFIADEIVARYSHLSDRYDYLDFYLGSSLSAQRADLTPVYRWVFGVLLNAGCQWRYSFPRLYSFSVAEPPEANKPLDFDPSEAVRQELEAEARRDRHDTLADQLDALDAESVERARRAPPPPIVTAYRDVFGHWPDGWPPSAHANHLQE